MAQAHGLPAFLSLLTPGLGQLVKGEIWAGIGYFALVLILAGAGVLLAIFGLFFVSFVPWLLGTVVWIGSVIDAYGTARALARNR